MTFSQLPFTFERIPIHRSMDLTYLTCSAWDCLLPSRDKRHLSIAQSIDNNGVYEQHVDPIGSGRFIMLQIGSFQGTNGLSIPLCLFKFLSVILLLSILICLFIPVCFCLLV